MQMVTTPGPVLWLLVLWEYHYVNKHTVVFFAVCDSSRQLALGSHLGKVANILVVL